MYEYSTIYVNKKQQIGVGLTLREWLKSIRLHITMFAILLKVERTCIYRWMKGSCKPHQRMMERIKEVSDGKVTQLEDKNEKI